MLPFYEVVENQFSFFCLSTLLSIEDYQITKM